MAPDKMIPAKRSASDAFGSGQAAEEVHASSNPAKGSRPVPCMPCIRAQLAWTPGSGEPLFCLEGKGKTRTPSPKVGGGRGKLDLTRHREVVLRGMRGEGDGTGLRATE